MKKNRGQISVFFGIMIMIIFTLTALVVNVGLFVKAKINLQNAVDAAAWSGAAVQSRQLTNAAYLNWEMRNIYKEWMFKYYVLGNLGLRKLNGSNPSPINGSISNFQMSSFNPTITSPGKVDQYNIPSICIQFAGTTNDCDLYKLPELPRFETSTSPGIAVTADVFLDNISDIRTKGCADKSRVNYEIATTWAYAVEGQSGQLAANAPQILAERPGAFPKAYELGVRVRSLESMLNSPPKSGGVCYQQGDAAGSCAQNITELSTSDSPHQERTVKAFYSAYRNLGNETDNEMKSSFTLTEIPPTAQNFPTESLSGLLYPGSNVDKHYVDLRLMPINFATFYTAFVAPPSSSVSGSVQGVFGNGTNFTGGCDATKIALPVPGYPLGFVKDPSTLTYYAVKGEANFVGLLNPLNEQFTKMTAYAAAKPFGGRIGPALFRTGDNNTTKARQSGNGGFLSRHYAAAFSVENATIYRRNGDTVPAPVPSFVLGAPVPINDFWVNNVDAALGGDPGSAGAAAGTDIRFSIPNLVWSAAGTQTQKDELMNIIPGNPDTVKAFGLYNFTEYNRFKSVLPPGAVSPSSMQQAVYNLRAPTDYEAYNYLIPSPKSVNTDQSIASFPPIQNLSAEEGYGRIYAPLFSPRGGQFPYSSISTFRDSFENYLQKQAPAVEKYMAIMREVALTTLSAGADPSFATDYAAAANLFSTLPDGASSNTDGLDGLLCDSIAGSFYQYFMGGTSQVATGANCPDPLGSTFSQYWSGNIVDVDPNYHEIRNFQYFQNAGSPQSFFTAYSPGQKYGGDVNGNVQHPVLGTTQNMIRNFYSTKFTSISSIRTNTSNSYSDNRGFNIFSSGKTQPEPDTEQNGSSLANPIDSSFIHHDLGSYWK